MIENLHYELYKLEKNQAKGTKLLANIRSRRAKNAFFRVFDRQNM